MDYKISIFFNNGKNVAMVNNKQELEEIMRLMSRGLPYWNKESNSGFGIPVHNIMYYSFSEYTDEMKKADQEAIKKTEEEAKKLQQQEEEKKR